MNALNLVETGFHMNALNLAKRTQCLDCEVVPMFRGSITILAYV